MTTRRLPAPPATVALVLVLVLVLTFVACSGSSDPGGGDASSPVAAGEADCSPARSDADVAPGEIHTLDFDGVERQYLLAVPEDDDGTEAHPLVIDFHGHGGTMADHAADTGMAAEGTTWGYVVVTPQALGDPSRWNFTGAADQADDFGFVHALIADLSARMCLDPDRVFVAGHSNGSAFAAFLACHEPYEIAAVAMVSATTPVTCPDGVTPAALAMHGTADPTVPYEGGGNRNLPPAPEIMAGWAEHHGCSPEPTVDAPAAGIERTTWDDCAPGTAVVLDTIEGGRHAWPGSPQAGGAPGNSDAGRAFPATTEILDFFAAHPRTTS